MNDFQKSFLARGTGQTLFTQKEFDDELAVAKAQIMQIAIETTRTAISIEREECAKVCEDSIYPEGNHLAVLIRDRMKK